MDNLKLSAHYITTPISDEKYFELKIASRLPFSHGTNTLFSHNISKCYKIPTIDIIFHKGKFYYNVSMGTDSDFHYFDSIIGSSTLSAWEMVQ